MYLEKSEILIDVPAHRQVIDAHVSEHLSIVDEESASEGEASVIKHAVALSNALVDVSNQRDVNGAEPPFLRSVIV